MHRREVKEELLLKYYHFENPQVQVVKDDNAPAVEDTPLKALAKRQQARHQEAQALKWTDNASSIFGLPMANPAGRSMVLWTILMLLVDGIYTALWVPVEAAFDLPHDIGTVTGTLDFCVGVLLCVDIFLRFHTPIELTSSYMTYMLKQVRRLSYPLPVVRCSTEHPHSTRHRDLLVVAEELCEHTHKVSACACKYLELTVAQHDSPRGKGLFVTGC